MFHTIVLGTDGSASRETEAERETETPETPTDNMIINREKLDKLLAQEREKGMAWAFGLLQGGGYLEAVAKDKRLTEAKEFVFGKVSGRRLSDVINPLVREVGAEAGVRRLAPPIEVRTITVNDGREIML